MREPPPLKLTQLILLSSTTKKNHFGPERVVTPNENYDKDETKPRIPPKLICCFMAKTSYSCVNEMRSNLDKTDGPEGLLESFFSIGG